MIAYHRTSRANAEAILAARPIEADKGYREALVPAAILNTYRRTAVAPNHWPVG